MSNPIPPSYGHHHGQQPGPYPPPPVMPGPPQQYGPPQQQTVYAAPHVTAPVKRHNPYNVLAVIIAAVVGLVFVIGLFGAIASPNNTASKQPGVEELKNGAADPAQARPADDKKQFDLKVGSVLTLTSGDDVQEWTLTSFKFRQSCGGLSQAKHGGYLIIDVRVVQKSGTGSVNPLFLDFVATDGTTEDSMSGMFSGCEQNDPDSTNGLRAGQKRVGQVTFDVVSPSGAIELTPGLGEDTAGSWKLR
jgi:hypothetical protein